MGTRDVFVIPLLYVDENLKMFIEQKKNYVLFKTALITRWARITGPSVARVEATGGGSTAFGAMTT